MKNKKTFDEIQPIIGELSNIKKRRERESILQTEHASKRIRISFSSKLQNPEPHPKHFHCGNEFPNYAFLTKTQKIVTYTEV